MGRKKYGPRCEVRGCGREAILFDTVLGSRYCGKHRDVWEAEGEAQLDHTERATGSSLDLNARGSGILTKWDGSVDDPPRDGVRVGSEPQREESAK